MIGELIWLDLNGDGVPDDGEPGIGGVTVTLTLQGGGTLTTVTDSDGFYSFGNVPDGTHTVTVDTSTLPTGLTQSGDPDQAGTCTTCDNSGSVTISGSNTDMNFGYELSGPHSISGTVFLDENENGGDQEDGEDGLPGITVYLWRDTNGDGVGDQLVGTTQTAADGSYSFDSLPSENYTVSVDPASPAISAASLTTAANQNDGDAYEHVLSSELNAIDVDFGYDDGILAVQLAAFEASCQQNQILVTWQTVSELDHLGFNLYRNTTPDALGEQLNSELIASQAPGSGQGSSYEWINDTEIGTTYYYWLEDVSLRGISTQHGPVSVTCSPTAVILQELNTEPNPVNLPLALLGLTLLTGIGLIWRRQRA
jgi:hypothetical protein